MPERLHRLGGHLRRNLVAYAALAVAFSFSPVPSMAADLVTTNEIANGAVTAPKLSADSVVSGKIVNGSVVGVDIKDGTVGPADLSDAAKNQNGARVIRYDLGPHDFASEGYLSVQLPGTWTLAAVERSQWTASVTRESSNGTFTLPGYGVGGLTSYYLQVTQEGTLYIFLATGAGEAYTSVRVYQTLSTSTRAAP